MIEYSSGDVYYTIVKDLPRSFPLPLIHSTLHESWRVKKRNKYENYFPKPTYLKWNISVHCMCTMWRFKNVKGILLQFSSLYAEKSRLISRACSCGFSARVADFNKWITLQRHQFFTSHFIPKCIPAYSTLPYTEKDDIARFEKGGSA